MKLDINTVRAITGGASWIEETSRGFEFHRFSKEQEELYKRRSADFYHKTFATAGIELLFYTDSHCLYMSVDAIKASSRYFYSFDVLVNGDFIGSIDNFSSQKLPEKYSIYEFPAGESKKQFNLGNGEKFVEVIFPWSAQGIIRDISVDDGAFVTAVEPRKKLLVFGDSITQGYDSLHPLNRYPSILSRKLNLSEYNKAIGGEVTLPELAASAADISPDYIVSAYGTNDWSHLSASEFIENSAAFYKNIEWNYPDAKVFCIAPIWRKDYQDYRRFGQFQTVYKLLADICSEYKQVYFIDGFQFVPHNEVYFSDGYLHPNDSGFKKYADSLIKVISPIL